MSRIETCWLNPKSDGDRMAVMDIDAKVFPGDDPRNPAYTQHQIATRIEKTLCKALHISWKTYDREIERVWRTRA